MKSVGSNFDLRRRLTGVLLGTAVGDALGLPAENLPPERIRKMWGGRWRMRFICGRGMTSDDTEHTAMVAQALLSHPDDPVAFQRALAWKLRWWFACVPGGVGLATARACLKLWVGFPPTNSAVVSAGSGPAMRSAILGAYFADEPQKRRNFVLASSRLTHRGWQAETAALAVAECAALTVLADGGPATSLVLANLASLSEQNEWRKSLSEIESALANGDSVATFVYKLGMMKGVSGYALHVVPVALYAWLRHPGEFRAALISALECGGDTDTVGAILGALAGAVTGKSEIPAEWLANICEWPRSCGFLERIAERLATQKTGVRRLGPVRYFWPGLIPRNALFLAVVLTHGFRRLAPPY
jgi:ADP-ribosyl-[dinitrogen reductase] hydrolase